jgi:Pentapeptide repeats (8 copies)
LRTKPVKSLVQIVGGAAVLASLYFTWGALEVSREGQITDRFTKAIAQLGEQGSEKLAVRLGGIYALERIARDSERDHWPIMEVLTAYVREHAPWPPKRPKDVQPSEGNQAPQEEPRATLKQPPPQLAADIQAVLTVLGQRTHAYEKGKEQRLNLANTDLRGAILRGAQLQGAILASTQLQEAWLGRARLAGATHLTVEQLSVVKTLYQATLDPPLLEQIQQRYAPLLEAPQ